MTANGLYALYPNVISLGDLSPEYRTVVVDRPNPKAGAPGEPETVKVPLRAYVNGKRTLLAIAVAYSAARRAWVDALTVKDENDHPVLDPETGQAQRLEDTDGTYWTIFLATALQAVVRGETPDEPGLTQDEALVLAFNGNRAITMLEDWGWFRKRTEDAPDPEAVGETSPMTGGSVSPISASTSTGVGPI